MTEAGSEDRAGARGAAGAGLGGWFTVLLMIAVAGLSFLVLRLASQNRELKQRLEAKLAAEAIPSDAIKVGEAVGPLHLTDMSGDTDYSFDPPGAAMLVLQHSLGCGFCEETLPVWADALRTAGETGVRVVCVQVGAHSKAELQALEPPLQPSFDREAKTSWLKRAAIVPSAVLVGPDGVVKRLWIGRMSKEQGKELVMALVECAAESRGH